MQNYVDIKGSDLVKNSRETINNNIKTVGSNYSGTSFPTTNLLAGMLCFRTDTRELHLCESVNVVNGQEQAVWRLLLKLDSNNNALVVRSTNSEYVSHNNKVYLPDGSIMWVE